MLPVIKIVLFIFLNLNCKFPLLFQLPDYTNSGCLYSFLLIIGLSLLLASIHV
jgi:hypothetical protein